MEQNGGQTHGSRTRRTRRHVIGDAIYRRLSVEEVHDAQVQFASYKQFCDGPKIKKTADMKEHKAAQGADLAAEQKLV